MEDINGNKLIDGEAYSFSLAHGMVTGLTGNYRKKSKKFILYNCAGEVISKMPVEGKEDIRRIYEWKQNLQLVSGFATTVLMEARLSTMAMGMC